MTQKVSPAAVRVRHGGTPAPQVHFSHKYNGHYWQKTFPPPPYDIIISLLWKKSTIRIDKIITKFFCNFHRKFTLCLLPVTIPKTQKSLFSPKYGTFWLPWFSWHVISFRWMKLFKFRHNNRRLFADFSGICRDAEGLPDGTTLAPIRGLFVGCFCSARREVW